MTNVKTNSGFANLFSSGCWRVHGLRTVHEKPDERLEWSPQNRCHTAQHSPLPGWLLALLKEILQLCRCSSHKCKGSKLSGALETFIQALSIHSHFPGALFQSWTLRMTPPPLGVFTLSRWQYHQLHRKEVRQLLTPITFLLTPFPPNTGKRYLSSYPRSSPWPVCSAYHPFWSLRGVGHISYFLDLLQPQPLLLHGLNLLVLHLFKPNPNQNNHHHNKTHCLYPVSLRKEVFPYQHCSLGSLSNSLKPVLARSPVTAWLLHLMDVSCCPCSFLGVWTRGHWWPSLTLDTALSCGRQATLSPGSLCPVWLRCLSSELPFHQLDAGIPWVSVLGPHPHFFLTLQRPWMIIFLPVVTALTSQGPTWYRQKVHMFLRLWLQAELSLTLGKFWTLSTPYLWDCIVY